MIGDIWIANGTAKPFYARKCFDAKAGLSRATISVCGLGQYNFYLNGKRAGNIRIGQSWTDYNKIVQYADFDITDGVRTGKNALGFEVGNGWYILDETGYAFHFPKAIPLPPNPNPYKPFAKSLVLSFELRLEYADGTAEIIDASGAKITAHGVKAANVYGSEDIDGAKLQRGFSKIDFDDSAWQSAKIAGSDEKPRGELLEQKAGFVRVLRSETPKCVRLVDEICVFDVGENTAAVLECEVRGKAGDEITFFFAEKCDERGLPDQFAKGWDEITSRIVYKIAKSGEWEHFEQTFSYFAGRFIGVKGNADVKNMRAIAVSSATEDAGDFISDNEKYNQIFRMVKKSVEDNLMSVHTDCPTIERFAWQEENHLMARSIFYLKNEKAMWEKMLLDSRAAQHTKSDWFNDGKGGKIFPGAGLVPSQAPCYMPNVLPGPPGTGSFYDIIAWGSFIILGAKWHYLHYGDKSVIADNFEAGKRYFAHLKTKVTAEGFINHGLGDWGNPSGEVARENTETAFFYADAATLSEFAQILNQNADAEYYRAEAEAIKQNYNARLLKKGENGFFYAIFGDETQKISTSAQALPLFWGIVPEEAKCDVENAFKKSLEADGALKAGEVSLPYIIQTANHLGLNHLIARYILREEHPSYYAFVKDGETTLGEYWEKNPRSHNHDMMGSIAEWFFNGLAGIEPLSPGFSRVKITPFLPDDMRSFRAVYDTPHGTIRVSARRGADGKSDFTIEVPAEIQIER